MRAFDDVKKEAKAFLLDSEGLEVKRSELIKKIFKAFEKEDTTDIISQRLFRVYSEHKLARMDTEFPMTSYAVKKLDKLSLL